MILYDNDSLIIPVGLGNIGFYDSASLQEKTVTILENTSTIVKPDSNYDGLSKVNIITNIPSDVNNQNKEIQVPIRKTVTVTPDTGYTGLDKVVVSSTANLEAVSIDIDANGTYNIEPDSSFDAISNVKLSVSIPETRIENQTKVVQVPIKKTVTVTPDTGYTGLDKVVVTGTANLQNKSLEINENGNYSLIPDESYDAISKVDLNISVPDAIIKNQSKTIDSSTEIQTVIPDTGYSGLDSVTVNPYIMQSKRSTGALLTYNIQDIQAGYYTITPETGYDGINLVNIRKTGILKELSLDPSTNVQKYDVREQTTYQYGVKEITVNPVTSDIDSNIKPENIKSGIEILGVQGEHVPDSQRALIGVFQAAPANEKIDLNIDIFATDWEGLTYLDAEAFNQSTYYNKYRNIEFPSTLQGMRLNVLYSTTVTGNLDFSRCNIPVFPRPANDEYVSDNNYGVILRSTIKGSLKMPDTTTSFNYKEDLRSYLIQGSSVNSIDFGDHQYSYIGHIAENSNIQTIKIYNVSYIEMILRNVTGLTDVYCYSVEPPSGNNLVDNINTGGTLHVPKGSYDSYNKSAWMTSSNKSSFGDYGWTLVDDL